MNQRAGLAARTLPGAEPNRVFYEAADRSGATASLQMRADGLGRVDWPYPMNKLALQSASSLKNIKKLRATQNDGHGTSEIMRHVKTTDASAGRRRCLCKHGEETDAIHGPRTSIVTLKRGHEKEREMKWGH